MKFISKITGQYDSMYRKQKKTFVLRALRKYLHTIETLKPCLLHRIKEVRILKVEKRNSIFFSAISKSNTYESIKKKSHSHLFLANRIFRDQFSVDTKMGGKKIPNVYRKSNEIISFFSEGQKSRRYLDNYVLLIKQHDTGALLKKKEPKKETIIDNWVPVSNIEKINRGISSLYLQGSSPSKSYFDTRLQANFIYEKHIAGCNMAKGMSLHYALNLIWVNIKKDRKLFRSFLLNKKDIIALSSRIAVKKFFNKELNYFSFSIKYALMNWMVFEMRRQCFNIVGTEKIRLVDIGKIPFCFRSDRIDQLIDKKRIIIDYKYNKYNFVFKSNITGIQLPIYCLLLDKAKVYDGLCIGLMSEKSLEIKTIAQENKVKNTASVFNWKSFLFRWKDSLEKLSYEFCQGLVEG